MVKPLIELGVFRYELFFQYVVTCALKVLVTVAVKMSFLSLHFFFFFLMVFLAFLGFRYARQMKILIPMMTARSLQLGLWFKT